MSEQTNRCAICGWTLAASVELGCVRGNCSQRPFPERLFDHDRAESEYRRTFKRLPPIPDTPEVTALKAQRDALASRCQQLETERGQLLARIETLRAVKQELQGRIANALL